MHFLARELGMLVSDLVDRIEPQELADWAAYYDEVNRQRERAFRSPPGKAPAPVAAEPASGDVEADLLRIFGTSANVDNR